MRTDILYVVRPENGSDYEDLRLSLRSVARNCVNVGKIYLVGGVPEWIDKRNVICLPHADSYSRKHKNILDAITYVAEHTEIGKDMEHGLFMYSSDDHFYIKPDTDMRWGAMPLWFSGNIHGQKDIEEAERSGNGANGWLHSMVETRAILTMYGHNVLMFSQHANTWFSRELMEEINFKRMVHSAKECEYGCEPSCLMGNYMLTRHPEWIDCICHRKDVKIPNMMDDEELYRIFRSGRECVSGSPNAAKGNMVKMLRRMFAEKSKYEK